MAFPTRENPARPGLRHVAYVVEVFAKPGQAGTAFEALAAYTTSQPWPHAAKPFGLFAFDQQQAAGLGQDRAFVLDLRRVAYVPVTPAWFPDLARPGGGIQGRAPATLRRQLRDAARELLTRHVATVERLGPLWPDSSRR